MTRFFKISSMIILITIIAFVLCTIKEWYFFSTHGRTLLKEKDPITVIFAADDNYILPLSVALTSLNMNTKTPVEIFLLTEGLSEKNIKTLKHIDDKFTKLTIHILPVNSSVFDQFPTNDRWSKSSYFRYLIPELLPLHKRAIYLDADILIFKDLSDFFETNLNNTPIGGISDAFEDNFLQRPLFKDHKFYINSGVLLLDLEKLRKLNITKQLFKATDLNKDKFTHFDQDAINYVLKDNIKIFPTKYNAQQRVFTPYHKVIYHYSGKKKPWTEDNFSYYEWYKYFDYSKALLKDQSWPYKTYFKYLLNKSVYYFLVLLNQFKED